jgi:hypothetical protein
MSREECEGKERKGKERYKGKEKGEDGVQQ